MSKLYISASYDYINGHLRYGHAELEIDKAEWEAMSPQEQADYFSDNSQTVIDDYRIEDKGDLGELEVQELK